MENIIKQIREIESDLHTVISRAEEYRNDAERGINVNHTCEGDMSWTKQDKINSLFEYLEDAIFCCLASSLALSFFCLAFQALRASSSSMVLTESAYLETDASVLSIA